MSLSISQSWSENPFRAHGAIAVVAAIPYRDTPAVSTGSMVSAVLLTVLLLGLLVVALVLARRYGWLRSWFGIPPASSKAPVNEMRILSRARLSPTTRAFVLENEGCKYLVLESSQNIAMQAIPSSEKRDDDAHE